MYYKIDQLKKMLAADRRQPENEKYGATLTHWSKEAKPINIDEEAIECLIKHYKSRMLRQYNISADGGKSYTRQWLTEKEAERERELSRIVMCVKDESV